eukprot:TRINITY_DN8706_c0_g1_i1.p1 TRINITY_DN8706_c0_g1~~TRINITY_DN8706_c0_g1_i1.p1  ORF type:complete len:134 (+),score=34.58 TRINITY_DN8706_c0_g1_i1:23-424(+)
MSWLARLSTNMQEVRLVLCARSESSRGARLFIEKNYQQIKRLNPKLPFHVRHGIDVSPRIIARYDYGGEAHRELANLSEEEIKLQLKELVELGAVALKADVYPWQESVPKDEDVIPYDPQDPTMHHVAKLNRL